MDIWVEMEKRLKTLKAAGIKEVGEELKPQYRGGPPRQQIVEEHERKERWIHYKQKRWPEW